MAVPIPQCFQSESVFSLEKSGLLLLSGHKPQHYIPVQANTSNSSHKQAGTECSSPWLRHESPLLGTLPSWKHALGSSHWSKGLARMLAVLCYANYRGSSSRTTRSTANATLGKKEEFLVTKATWNCRQSGLKRHIGFVSTGSLRKTRQRQEDDFNGEGKCSLSLPTHTYRAAFWTGCFQDVKANLL